MSNYDMKTYEVKLHTKSGSSFFITLTCSSDYQARQIAENSNLGCKVFSVTPIRK